MQNRRPQDPLKKLQNACKAVERTQDFVFKIVESGDFSDLRRRELQELRDASLMLARYLEDQVLKPHFERHDN